MSLRVARYPGRPEGMFERDMDVVKLDLIYFQSVASSKITCKFLLSDSIFYVIIW